ncbi:hypothetical protein [Neobacillus cucumis]|uniref:hypothetical protein n=1 Tax=Neobacillus cucumis TaxID=1740721 RepID=UPI002E226432|nr:hypothetical protein [Neobacillus cucumis]
MKILLQYPRVPEALDAFGITPDGSVQDEWWYNGQTGSASTMGDILAMTAKKR